MPLGRPLQAPALLLAPLHALGHQHYESPSPDDSGALLGVGGSGSRTGGSDDAAGDSGESGGPAGSEPDSAWSSASDVNASPMRPPGVSSSPRRRIAPMSRL